MSDSRIAAVLLAAGLGTRMKSEVPKVLHPIAGQPMIGHLLNRLADIKPDCTIVVVSSQMSAVEQFVAPVQSVIQEPPLGTGHAVLAAREVLEGFGGDILILFGDTPLLTEETISTMVAARQAAANPAVVVLGFRPDAPSAYGRLLTTGSGTLDRIVEYKDCDETEVAIGLCNAGIMVVDGERLFGLLEEVSDNNSNCEYYLTDIVQIARSKGWLCTVVETEDPNEVMGVNSRGDLANAEAEMQERLRDAAMTNGATLTAPGTVWFSYDTKLGRDVVIGPNVCFGVGVTIADKVEIRAFSHIEGATIAEGAIIGPYARLRPGSDIGRDVHIGNFVEVKAAQLDDGAKANHLSYIGDSWVGAGANIGAGTITCNFDGYFKSRTEIGEGAFIGSNTALVAPVKIGKGAVIGAGSTISKDVPADALSITRPPQEDHAGWAMKYRVRKEAQQVDASPSKKKKTG